MMRYYGTVSVMYYISCNLCTLNWKVFLKKNFSPRGEDCYRWAFSPPYPVPFVMTYLLVFKNICGIWQNRSVCFTMCIVRCYATVIM